MNSSEIKLSDWTRFFHGEAPGAFYFEIIIRVFFIYLILMVSMRLMGKRMSSQLSRNELAALVALAASVGVPMLDATRGILPAIIIAAIIVITQRMLALWAYRDPSFEKISQGNYSVLVNDSTLNLKQMQQSRISRERLFSQLRSQCVMHLGEVKRLYFEANGNFTIIRNTEPEPGLLVLPYSDPEFVKEKVETTDIIVCMNCGKTKPGDKNAKDNTTRCVNCGESNWTEAVCEPKQ